MPSADSAAIYREGPRVAFYDRWDLKTGHKWLVDVSEQVRSCIEMTTADKHRAWVPAVEEIDEMGERTGVQDEGRRWFIVPTALKCDRPVEGALDKLRPSEKVRGPAERGAEMTPFKDHGSMEDQR